MESDPASLAADRTVGADVTGESAASAEPVLVVLSGLPGTGKTTIAAALAAALGAQHLRIDSIEQALRNCGAVKAVMADTGYRIGYGVAKGNLRGGRSVIADSVNPVPATRDAWRDAAARSGALLAEVELVCSDRDEHRRRVESRTADIDGLVLPTWKQVNDRNYRPWDRPVFVVDTAADTPDTIVAKIAAMVRPPSPEPNTPAEMTTKTPSAAPAPTSPATDTAPDV